MPIYEFYCRDCHTLFNFFSAAVAPDAQPVCPRCAVTRLEKRPSTFVTLRHKGQDEDPNPFDDLDEGKLEGAMETLVQEMGDPDPGEDPRKLGKLFRRFGEITGLEMGPRMEEALSRMEGGEDLETLEAEMGDDLASEEDSLDDFFKLKKAVLKRKKRPQVDDTLYFL